MDCVACNIPSHLGCYEEIDCSSESFRVCYALEKEKGYYKPVIYLLCEDRNNKTFPLGLYRLSSLSEKKIKL